METFVKAIAVIGLSVTVLLGAAMLFTIPTYFLWNWLMPTIFGLTKITLLQTLGLLMLSGLLFKSGVKSDD